MLYGMPTLAEYETLEQNVRLGSELGLAFIEINMNLPAYQLPRLAASRLSAYRDMDFTIHLDENLNPCDWNDAVAGAWRETTLGAIRLAKDEGLRVLNMHLSHGVYFTLPSGKLYLFDRYWAQYRERLLRLRDDAARAIGGDPVRITVENTVWGDFSRLEEATELLLEAPCFSLCYDAGHDAADGGRARPFYDKHRSRWTHMHLHDCRNGTCHLPPGDGDIDIGRLLCCAEQCAVERIVLEVKTPEGLARSVRRLRAGTDKGAKP